MYINESLADHIIFLDGAHSSGPENVFIFKLKYTGPSKLKEKKVKML